MGNYNDLTNEDINQRIIERLGWEVYELECNGRRGWNWRARDGSTQNWCYPTPDVPHENWASNLNRAFDLLNGLVYEHITSPDLHSIRVGMGWHGGDGWAVEGTFARAACVAWLKFQERRSPYLLQYVDYEVAK